MGGGQVGKLAAQEGAGRQLRRQLWRKLLQRQRCDTPRVAIPPTAAAAPPPQPARGAACLAGNPP